MRSTFPTSPPPHHSPLPNLIHFLSPCPFALFLPPNPLPITPRTITKITAPNLSMATALSSFPAPLVASLAPPRPRNRKNPTASDKSSIWWAPIFGWPSEPDYFDNNVKIEAAQPEKEPRRIASDAKPLRGHLTMEKAKELRRKTMETYNFHDVMYHSAIASRLASDVSGR